jgi:magnesium-transporting ATPase (P-type)
VTTAETQPPPETTVDPEGRAELVLDRFQTGRHGLTSREAARRLAQYGSNEIRREASRSRLREFANQLVDPLARGRPRRSPSPRARWPSRSRSSP